VSKDGFFQVLDVSGLVASVHDLLGRTVFTDCRL
jgi:hypothetical protein